jgi:hypothetical protein
MSVDDLPVEFGGTDRGRAREARQGGIGAGGSGVGRPWLCPQSI